MTGGGENLSEILSATETLSSDINIAITGQNGTATANDICLESFIIVKHSLDPDS